MPGYLERTFLWIGGTLFVASLALTVWIYTTRFEGSAAFGGWPPVAFDALLFAFFALHHSLFSRERVKHAMTALVPERLLRSVYVWMASGLLIFVCLAWRPIGGFLYSVDGALALPFTLVQAAGFLMIASSVTAIHPLELAGIRTPAAHERLQITGAYGIVRHPLYLGWVLIVWGPAHMTGDRLAFALVTTAYLVMAVPWEERSLEQMFGAEYRAYKMRVRWRIVPGLY